MTLAIFPIETDIKGGTMHTVKFAQEQNRLIFCPDINLLKDKYQPNFAKIRGIRHLLDSKIAQKYSSNHYDKVLNLLEKHRLFLKQKISSTLKLF